MMKDGTRRNCGLFKPGETGDEAIEDQHGRDIRATRLLLAPALSHQRQGHKGLESWGDLPKVTELVGTRAGVRF